MDKEYKSVFGLILRLVGVTLLLVVSGLAACPQYNVYEQRLSGEAELAKAQFARQVQIQDAQSKMEAAKSLAQAEVERAKGVAQANQIIGNSLKENEAYLRWLYIEALKEKTGAETIYIPTEAGLPILEAGRKRVSQ